jgi:pimeloyl-ACP methyl ester carboxylesterase
VRSAISPARWAQRCSRAEAAFRRARLLKSRAVREPLFEHRLELAGYSTRALELEGEGSPVVLLHGYADSADTWRLVLERLGREGRPALAIDLPGFGRADPLGDGPMLPQYDRVVEAAIRYAAAERGRPAVLTGNSLGGCLTLRAGARDDLPLEGIVPIAPAGLDMPGWFSIIQRDVLMRALLTARAPLPERVVRRSVGEVYRRLAFARPGDAPDELVAMFTSHHPTTGAVKRLRDLGARLLPELTLESFDLEAISMPLLLIWGDRDRMVSHSGARHVLAAVPGAGSETLEGVGHCPQLEDPARLTDLLTAFLDERAHGAKVA